MKNSKSNQGSTLIEAVLAMGILAIVIPLVFGVIAESKKSNFSSKAETFSNWIVPMCIDQIQASRDGRSAYFPATLPQESFPLENEVWALGFSPEGKIVNRITVKDYQKGIVELDQQSIRFIASISTIHIQESADVTPMLHVKINLEYPAAVPAHKREKLAFYTHIP
ncbi:MAG: type II secretion system protein [Akkermansiaceae bacterium]|nr:type II secretion system protein [Akkermansiaceae bacterium]NJR42641.1 type II secretion system protein [Akkermansiaceae bacterium]